MAANLCDTILPSLFQVVLLQMMQATFEDELQDQAIAKKHSLTREAVDIGRQVKSIHIY